MNMNNTRISPLFEENGTEIVNSQKNAIEMKQLGTPALSARPWIKLHKYTEVQLSM